MWPSSGLRSLQPGPLKLSVLLPRPHQLATHVLHLGIIIRHVSRDKEKDIWLRKIDTGKKKKNQHRRIQQKFLYSVLFCLTRVYICIHKQAEYHKQTCWTSDSLLSSACSSSLLALSRSCSTWGEHNNRTVREIQNNQVLKKCKSQQEVWLCWKLQDDLLQCIIGMQRVPFIRTYTNSVKGKLWNDLIMNFNFIFTEKVLIY